MDQTLMQILRALVTAHAELDQLREALREAQDELEAETKRHAAAKELAK